jgi:hypothetical protein
MVAFIAIVIASSFGYLGGHHFSFSIQRRFSILSRLKENLQNSDKYI